MSKGVRLECFSHFLKLSVSEKGAVGDMSDAVVS